MLVFVACLLTSAVPTPMSNSTAHDPFSISLAWGPREVQGTAIRYGLTAIEVAALDNGNLLACFVRWQNWQYTNYFSTFSAVDGTFILPTTEFNPNEPLNEGLTGCSALHGGRFVGSTYGGNVRMANFEIRNSNGGSAGVARLPYHRREIYPFALSNGNILIASWDDSTEYFGCWFRIYTLERTMVYNGRLDENFGSDWCVFGGAAAAYEGGFVIAYARGNGPYTAQYIKRYKNDGTLEATVDVTASLPLGFNATAIAHT